jgi:hypothetical protein
LKGIALKNNLILLCVLALLLSACGQPVPPARETTPTIDLFIDFEWPGRIMANPSHLWIYIPIEATPQPK